MHRNLDLKFPGEPIGPGWIMSHKLDLIAMSFKTGLAYVFFIELFYRIFKSISNKSIVVYSRSSAVQLSHDTL